MNKETNYITLTIKEEVKNPDYTDEVAEWNKNKGYGHSHNNDSIPIKFHERNTMDVRITKEQFEAIRKAVLEKF